MATKMEELEKEIQTLSAPERATLAKNILLSLEDSHNPEDDAALEAAWILECQKRAQAYEQDPTRGRPADEVFKDLRSRF